MPIGPYLNPATLSLFLSYYKSNDDDDDRQNDVRQLADHLKVKRGLNVWLSEDFGEDDEENIDNADMVLVFYSGDYLKDDRCLAQIAYAEKRNKPVLPVQMQRKTKKGLHWVGARQIPDFANIIEERLFEMHDEAYRNKFRLINPHQLHRFQYRTTLNFRPFLDKIREIIPENRFMVVTGDDGVGKTYFMSLLLLQPKCRRFLKEKCQIGTVFWFNCYPWHDEFKFGESAKIDLEKRIISLLCEATKRGVEVDFDEQIAILTKNLQSPPFFVFDDVFHTPLFEFLRKTLQSVPFAIITRTQCFDDFRSRIQFDHFLRVEPFSLGEISNMLRSTFGLKDLNDVKLQSIAEECEGLPRKAAEKAFQQAFASVPGKKQPISRLTSNGLAVVGNGPLGPELKSVNVPNFNDADYFPRPTEEEALRNALRFLCKNDHQSDHRFFAIEGSDGVGKTALVSHVLRDSNNQTFLKRECNLQAVIWLNCYQWRDGCQEETFMENLFKLIQEITKIGEMTTASSFFDEKSLRILVVLDDVFHHSIVDTLWKKCPNVLYITLTKNVSQLVNNLMDTLLNSQLKAPLVKVNNLSEKQSLDFLETSCQLRGKLTDSQLVDLARRSSGLPLVISLIGGLIRWSRSKKKLTCKEILRNQIIFPETLVPLIFEEMSKIDWNRLVTFVLFDPMEEIDQTLLRVIWNCDNLEDVSNISEHFERLCLIRRPNPSTYCMHEIFHKIVTERALTEVRRREEASYEVADVGKKGRTRSRSRNRNSRAYLLSKLRHRLLTPALLKSSREGDIKAVELLISKGKVNADGSSDDDGKTSLIAAVENGRFEVVQLLLSHGNANIDHSGKDGEAALIKAVRQGDEKCVQFLIVKGANVEANDKDGQTALILAIQEKFVRLAKLLIISKPILSNLNFETKTTKETALMISSAQGNVELVELLISNGVNVDWADKDGRTALMKAIEKGPHFKVIELLLPKCSVNLKDKDGLTALMLAAQEGLDDVVELLLSKGGETDIEASDSWNGETALMKAARQGYDQTVQLLLEKGASLNAVNLAGENVLMLLADGENDDVAELILGTGKVDVNARDKSGQTVLMKAARVSGNAGLVDTLLRYKADTKLEDSAQKTALDFALEVGNNLIVNILRQDDVTL